MRSSGLTNHSAPVIEKLESREMLSAAPLVWTGPYNNQLPGYGTYTYTATSAPSDPSPFTWNWSVVIRRHNGNSFGGWLWETADETGPRMKIEGGSSKDGFVHFRIDFTKHHRPPFVALYDPATKEYKGFFGYAYDHKFHAGQQPDANGSFVIKMSNPHKY